MKPMSSSNCRSGSSALSYSLQTYQTVLQRSEWGFIGTTSPSAQGLQEAIDMAPIAAASDIVSVAMQTGSVVVRDFYGRGLLTIEIESDNRAASRDWSTALSFSAPARAVPVSSLMPPEKVSVRDWSTAFPFRRSTA